MIATIVGVGLIGGSLSLTLKQAGVFSKVIGVDMCVDNLDKALALHIIDQALPLEDAIKKSNIIIISVPVDSSINIVEKVLSHVNEKQIVFDVGSTKFPVCNSIKNHPMRKRFVATHPMWGTEHSGPEAAVITAFKGRACVICDEDISDTDAVETVENMYKKIGMHIINMSALNHDVHAAYVSHVSHISSFALANTVLEKEKEEETIFEMAAGGFESTVRLAKSNANMWVPIFTQNKENVLDVLNEHISQLRKFKAALEKDNTEYLTELIVKANTIKRILK
jgi:prephenate dehydrogenase